MPRAMTFYYSEESGEMTTTNESAQFQASDGLLRADVLGDILGTVTTLYNQSVGQFGRELKRQQKK